VRCGLYGKLPAKRDFIAIATPREFLNVWEPWLQGGISASRNQLGAAWQEAFLRAPIWRFWLGRDLCGEAVIGALMPSVDGVGRYFPLTIFARAEPGQEIPPPEIDANDAWFDGAEDLLLSALSEGAEFDLLSENIGRFPGPAGSASPDVGPPGGARVRGGALYAPSEPGQLAATLTALRQLDIPRDSAGRSFWWTLGGEGFAPCVLSQARMPDPYLFTGMLTGRFEPTQ
jgi:type VI secretion system protein ImpM